MTTTTTPKLRSVTFLGVPARVGETKLGARRVYEIHWDAKAVGQPIEHPAGTVHFRVLNNGDERKGTLRMFNEAVTDEANADEMRRLMVACATPATDAEFDVR
jgi:hypothetical protein